MTDLFTQNPASPLAELMRPSTLADVVGQQHLVGPGKPLRMAFDSKKLHSFILWGPPGVGKTTIGRLAAQAGNSHFISISAVLAGVKDIRGAIEEAQSILDRNGQQTVIFIDEIHAFSKNQQDALLPHVESGLFILVGSTTEHPGMNVNNALLSRAQVYTLEPLGKEDFHQLYGRASPHLHGINLAPEALDLLIAYADGDGRRFLNLLEQVQSAAQGARLSVVDLKFAAQVTSPALRRADKGADSYYTQISAFHKSIRGSHPDAALYWMATMLGDGVKPEQIVRRLICIASEDVGNADPRAIQLALNAAEAVDRLGLPECELVMAQAVTFLASAPKSNASYSAWKQAKAFVQQNGTQPVPLHLRPPASKLMAEMGYGAQYRYAHTQDGAYAAGQTYLPSGMREPNWYQPVQRGLEIKIAQRLDLLKSLDAEADKK